MTDDTIQSANLLMEPFVESLSKFEYSSEERGFLLLDMFQYENRLRLWWHGPLPSDVSTIVEEATAAGVRVDVCYGKYSLSTLTETQHKIALADLGYQLASVGPSNDGSSLVIRGRDLQQDPAKSAQVLSSAQSIAGEIPVVVGPDSNPMASSRLAATSPYYGGSRLRISGGGSCSAGFAYNGGDVPKLLTAAHCADYSNNRTWLTGAGVTIGTSSWTSALWDVNWNDATMLNISSPRTSGGWMFDGGVNDASEFAKRVSGSAAVVNGQYIFSSGSFSGVLQSMYFSGYDHSVFYFNTGHWQDVRNVLNSGILNRSPVWGAGDSGGPLFRLASNDVNRVVGLGITSGLDVFNTPLDTYKCTYYATSCASEGWGTRLTEINAVSPSFSIKVS